MSRVNPDVVAVVVPVWGVICYYLGLHVGSRK